MQPDTGEGGRSRASAHDVADDDDGDGDDEVIAVSTKDGNRMTLIAQWNVRMILLS